MRLVIRPVQTTRTDAGGERVEGAGVAHLDLAEPAAFADGVPEFVDDVK